MRWVIYVTFPVSLLLLFVTTFNGTQIGPGVYAGVREYIYGRPGEEKTLWSELQTSTIWTDALLRAFFSIDNVMWTTYGSYTSTDHPLVGDVIWLVIIDTCYSLVAGVGIYGVIGFLKEASYPISAEGGFQLAFSVLPSAISMTSSNPRFWSGFLFLCWFLICFDT